MPFYEYECQACGAHHEAMQKMSDAPLKHCPDCGKAKLVRLISAPVFRLKGGGWYETDFKSDKEKKRNLAGAEDKPAGESDSATRRKPAKKADKPKAAERAAKPKAKALPAQKKAPAAKAKRKKAAKTKAAAKPTTRKKAPAGKTTAETAAPRRSRR